MTINDPNNNGQIGLHQFLTLVSEQFSPTSPLIINLKKYAPNIQVLR